MAETKTNEPASSRIEFHHEPVEARIRHFFEFTSPLTEDEVKEQAARCLTCGTPFCSAMCPLHNRPVDFNRLVREGRWHEAWNALNATNNFPEFTSRVCPALCEAGCTRYLLDDSAVGVKSIERAIIDRAWKSGWVRPENARGRTGKRVAVVGSGPAGLACAQQLARAGHTVTVFEKNERAGGLLALGMPDFKLPKGIIERRLEQMEAEGVRFRLSTAVGTAEFEPGIGSEAKETIEATTLLDGFDAVVIAAGSETPRDLRVPGREGKGVHFAMELLCGQNRASSGAIKEAPVTSKGCDVAVIGGGDTGSDCVGISRRQGAGKIWLVAHGNQPPEKEDKASTWPSYPKKLRVSSSVEEGCERLWDTETKEILLDAEGAVRGIRFVKTKSTYDAAGRRTLEELPGTEFEIPVQRVYIALGYTGPSSALLKAFGVEKTPRGKIAAADEKGERPFATSVPKVFACGDARFGESLIVRAIHEGRECAAAVDRFLMGFTELPTFR